MVHSKLTLVGAGPGDPELITLKGVKALQTADVVLYDALIDDSLLDYCSPQCLKIFVGKRLGFCAYTQEGINQLILNCCQEHGHVVRLKGGDPFVFGRGYEEIAIAKAFHIPYEVVSGVSSVVSVPASQGIPITSRGISESFWVCTGTTKTGGLSSDLALAAQSTATVVILMAMSKLSEIVALFTQHGRGGTPAAIIMNGTTAQEKKVIGTVSQLEKLSKDAEMANPAIIMIGDVVGLHEEFVSQYKSFISVRADA